jgi:LPXTG-motif cell wall-anchored protein
LADNNENASKSNTKKKKKTSSYNPAVRIICIILAILMVVGVIIVGIYSFALDANAVSAVLPATGDSNKRMWMIIIACVAAALLAAGIILPKLGKKGGDDTSDK